MPYQDGPMPKELHRIQKGNIGGVLLPAGGFRKREYVVRFGRWRASMGKFYLSEFIPEEDLDDLAQAVMFMRTRLAEARSRKNARFFKGL